MLLELDHPGIFVTAYDNDSFEKYNVGRQLCTPLDVDRNKAVAMIEKINLNFGLGWEVVPKRINELKMDREIEASNIYITCVDNASFRMKF